MKLRCLILDNLNDGALRLAGTECELDHPREVLADLIKRRLIQPVDDARSLIGSSVQPSVLYAALGAAVPLGDVVRAAFEASGMTLAEWNEQPDEQREAAIEHARVQLRLSNAPLSSDAIEALVGSHQNPELSPVDAVAGEPSELPPVGGKAQQPVDDEVKTFAIDAQAALDPVQVQTVDAESAVAAKRSGKGK